MKAIIYAGIGLFAIASVYGVADYYSSQKKGTLDKLYKEEDEAPVAVVKNEISTTVESDKTINTEAVKSKTVGIAARSDRKTKTSRRSIRLGDFSRGIILEKPLTTEAPKPVEVTKPVEVKKEEPAQKEDQVIEKVAAAGTETMAPPPPPERKLNWEMFSRAPLKKMTKKLVKN